MPHVCVVGLGPAGPDLVTAGTRELIAAHAHRFLRTGRHPAASVVTGATTFDRVYDGAERLEDVYRQIVDELVSAAVDHGSVLYAVPGSPVVAERTVELLLADGRAEVGLQPALSFADLAWARLGVDPLAAGARVVDGHRFTTAAAGERGPLLVGQCDTTDVLTEVKLAIGDAIETSVAGAPGDDLSVTVLHHLGLADEQVSTVRWDALDRAVTPDHLTSLWIPALAAPVAGELQRLIELAVTLREKCPWDREQTHQSLARHLLEESYEVLDTLDHLDPGTGEGYDHLEEELGDLLFQIVFHARLAAEAGRFTIADVARNVHDKLYFRHPHVFGDVQVTEASQVAQNWERLKQQEKQRESVFDGIPPALPSLALALKSQKRAAGLSIEPAAAADIAELAAAAASDPGEDVLARLLWSAVALAARAGIDPETVLRAFALQRIDAWRRAEAGRDATAG